MGRQRQQQQRRQQQFIFAGATAVLLYVILFGFGTSSTHNSSSLSISREAQEHLNAQQRLLLTTVQWPDGTLPPSASGARPKRKPASKQEAQTALQEHFVVGPIPWIQHSQNQLSSCVNPTLSLRMSLGVFCNSTLLYPTLLYSVLFCPVWLLRRPSM